ncbi:MAG: biosynthetic peptidoglycan transglycosylase [Acidobacteriota bacterium]
MLRFLVRMTALGLAVLALGALAAVLWWRHEPVELEAWRTGPPPGRWATWTRQEEVWREQGLKRPIAHVFAPLEDISEDLVVAVLVSEDIDFFGHGAIDVEAVREAVREWRRGRRLRGASTVTQQLAKNLFLTGERSVVRKLEEARIARSMERQLGKRRILELYLNVVEFGAGILGAQAAARRYYGCDAAQITGIQAAGLAATIPAPGRDNPATRSRRWIARRDVIAARMTRVEWLRAEVRRLRRNAPSSAR